MLKIAAVKLGLLGRVVSYNCADVKVKIGDMCIVDLDRGKDYGVVISNPEIMENFAQESEVKKIVRLVTIKDMEKIEKNKEDSKKAQKICEEKIEKSKLDMKLIAVEYVFDRSKLICYFSAEGRIDFRALVRDLAAQFKIRIELRQIGVRDEAKIVDGYGRCGQRFCCSNFCKDFDPVSIRMAKEQMLPLNPLKISGACGRLMCCLSYEYETYKELAKKMPKIGWLAVIKEGNGTIVDMDILRQTAVIELEQDQTRVKVSINDIKKIIKTKLKEDLDNTDLDSDELKEK